MSKSNAQTGKKSVGATSSRPHFEGKAKNNKGITLIALVITIIVMLILVGVSVTVALNGGLFKTAQDAADETELEKDKEMTLSSGRIKVGGKWYDSLEDYKAGKESADQSNEIIKNKAYSIGDEVTVGGEPFYIIAVDNENDKLTLLAKYCLKSDGTEQSDETYSEIRKEFSNTKYWYNSETETYEEDLNTLEVPGGVTSIITTVKAYGLSVTNNVSEGRLLTYNEADTLKGEHEQIIYGRSASDGYLAYWLGTACSSSGVWAIVPHLNGLTRSDLAELTSLGIRPVIEVSKDLIEK